MDTGCDWLLGGPAWVWYRVLVDPAHEPKMSPDVQAARRDRYSGMFFMETDFCKLKAPFIWYDVVHVKDALSRMPRLRH